MAKGRGKPSGGRGKVLDGVGRPGTLPRGWGKGLHAWRSRPGKRGGLGRAGKPGRPGESPTMARGGAASLLLAGLARERAGEGRAGLGVKAGQAGWVGEGREGRGAGRVP